MSSRNSRVRLPVASVGFSETHKRQRRFPARKRAAVTPKSQRASENEREQSTLTQLHYVYPSKSEDSDDPKQLSDEDQGFIEPRARKRRRIGAYSSHNAREELRQSTLTQIEWLDVDAPSDSDDFDERPDLCADYADKQKDVGGGLKLERERLGNDPSSEVDFQDEPSGSCGRSEQSYPQIGPEPEQETAVPISPNTNSTTYAKGATRPQQASRTPDKPIRGQVPSSQSPSMTPIVSRRDASPSKYRRSPLQELHPNLLNSHDREASLTPIKPRGTNQGEEDKENLETTHEYCVESREKATHVGSLPRRSRRISSHAMPPPQSSPSRLFPISSVRSSQATTVDSTQAIECIDSFREADAVETVGKEPLEYVRDATSPATSPAPLRLHSSQLLGDESQLPFSAMSGEDLVQCSSLSLIQDSDDIVTASQMGPESLLE